MTAISNPRLLPLLLLLLIPGVQIHAGPDTATEDLAIRSDAGLVFFARGGEMLARMDVEIAGDSIAHRIGLTGRTLRDDAAGMLFVYRDAKPRTFWMRNTPGALDIMFADTERRIFHIAREVAPMSDQLHASEGPAMYVIETRGGFAKRLGIAPGTRFDYHLKSTHGSPKRIRGSSALD